MAHQCEYWCARHATVEGAAVGGTKPEPPSRQEITR